MAGEQHLLLRSLPAIALSAEFLLGGLGRVSSFPFPQLHKRIYEKSSKTASVLYPAVPYRDVPRHLRWVGSWMIVTGVLLAIPKTRGSILTLALVYFWTGAGGYSQARTGMPYWLPACNALLGTLVWYLERRP